MRGQGRILVDHTHCGGRHITGIERITLELFSAQALAPLDVSIIGGTGTLDMVLRQQFRLPFELARDRRALMVCPGFPPSIATSLFGARVLPYIHDLFLLTRPQLQNARARIYMTPALRFAVARLPRFLVNSQTTGGELQQFCRPDAEITTYRPEVRNIFALSDAHRLSDAAPSGGPRLIALGTVEPRKNIGAAADIVAALRANGFPDASLDVVGRIGWGVDADALAARPGVTLHGYAPIEEIRRLVERADALISTSHDEGLGLPLLELQYAGLAVIAPDKPVFAEVLGSSGLLVDPGDPAGAARAIAARLAQSDGRARAVAEARANLARWNDLARRDHDATIDLIGRLSRALGEGAP